MPFDLLAHPVAFLEPRRLSPTSAWITHIPFAYTLVSMLRPRTLVELGVHHGDSYCAFCQAITELKIDTRCYGIDTWQGDPHAGFYPEQVLHALKQHHDPLYASHSTLLQSNFNAALSQFQDGSIDLLHIDGFHTYEAVRHDYDTWKPKVSNRGVILFHDTEVRHKDFGVWKFWEEVRDMHPSFNFLHGAGLGVLAVGTDLPEAFASFLNDAQKRPDAVRRYFCSMGMQIERQRLLSHIVTQVFHTQAMVNVWKGRLGHSVNPVSANPQTAFTNPAGYLRDLAKDVNDLLAACAPSASRQPEAAAVS